jgi:hypothetical protein
LENVSKYTTASCAVCSSVNGATAAASCVSVCGVVLEEVAVGAVPKQLTHQEGEDRIAGREADATGTLRRELPPSPTKRNDDQSTKAV